MEQMSNAATKLLKKQFLICRTLKIFSLILQFYIQIYVLVLIVLD